MVYWETAVAAGIDPLTGGSDRARRLLHEWLREKRVSTVNFRERTDLTPDPNSRYALAYEAVFEPASLEQARVEVWLTADGQAAVGFETWSRIARRLGVKGESGRFAAGHEPHRMTSSGLLSLLDKVADAQIGLSTIVLPVIGLSSVTAVIGRDALESLVVDGYQPVSWLSAISRAEFSDRTDLLHFQPW